MPIASALWLLIFAGPLDAPVRSTSWIVPDGAQVQVAALADGHAVGLWISRAKVLGLSAKLEELLPKRVQTMVPAPGQVAAIITFAWPVKSAKAKVGDQSGPNTTVTLEVELDLPHDALVDHIFAEPLPLPVSLEAHTLREADALLQTHHVAEGVLLLGRLKESYPLRAWVLLRMGDVALLDGQKDQACKLWSQAIANGKERTAARWAHIRGFVAGCEMDHPAWAQLLSRTGFDDPVGRQSAFEAEFALRFTQDLRVIKTILELAEQPNMHTVPQNLQEMLTARYLRNSSAFEVASFVATHDISRHPEAFDLQLLVASALCSLDIPLLRLDGSATKKAHSWMKLSPAARSVWMRSALNCALPLDWPRHQDDQAAPSTSSDLAWAQKPKTSDVGSEEIAQLKAPAKVVPSPELHLANLTARLADAERAAGGKHRLYGPQNMPLTKRGAPQTSTPAPRSVP